VSDSLWAGNNNGRRFMGNVPELGRAPARHPSGRPSTRFKHVIICMPTPLTCTMARARDAGSPDLKMPEPTNTPSMPSCIIRAASAGVATPPARQAGQVLNPFRTRYVAVCLCNERVCPTTLISSGPRKLNAPAPRQSSHDLHRQGMAARVPPFSFIASMLRLPAAKFTTGRRPRCLVCRTSSTGARISFAYT
jgi:hypothetical protein